jgi:HK97 family phage portal protein
MGRKRTKAFVPSAETFFTSLRQAMSQNAAQFSDPYSQNWAARAAIGAVYRVIRGVPLVGMAGDRRKPKDARQVNDNSPLALLLSRPNPMQSNGEFSASLVAYQMLEGAAYVMLYGQGGGFWTRDERALPTEMLPVDSRSVTVDRRNLRTNIIETYRVAGFTGIVPADAMLVMRDFNPRDLQCGSASLASVWAAMESDRLMDVFASALLNNGASPGMIIALKSDPGQSVKDDLRASFDDRHRGANKAGRTAVIGAELDLKPWPAQTAKDMEATAARDRNRDLVKAVLGVTDYEVGRVADYNRANSEAARAWLWTNTLLPMLNAIEDAMWSHVFEPISRGSRAAEWPAFDLSQVAALRGDLNTTATTAATLVGAGYDAEAVSEKLGLNLPVADYEEPEPPPPAEPVKSGLVIITKKARPIKPLPRRVALRLQQQWADHAERKLGVRWRRFTRKRYEETIRLVRNLTDLGPLPAATVERLVGAQDVWRAEARAAAESLRTTGASLVGNVEMELGGFARIDVGQEAYQLAAARRVGQMVNVGDKLRVRVRESIIRGIAEAEAGLDVDGLEKIIQQRFGARLPSNAATVARTEVGIFASDVRRSLMVAEGVDEHEWSAAMDEHTRETHRAVDGERRPMNERFSNGLMHPLETGAPAGEVVNCRCVELPYMREIEE